jgi:fructose-bisphosphate aldolase/6-deoxy-5-ketofructose 1-phosphate synthase
MFEIKIPLSVPSNKKSLYKQNYLRLTNNSGKLLLIAGDQKLEHLNDDFFGRDISKEDNNPEHLFKIAQASNGGVLATHLGLISQYGASYKNIPYIVKLNGRTNIGPNEEKNSAKCLWKVEDVLKFKNQSGLKIVGVGYTLYLGSKYEGKMLTAAAKLIFEAHQAGLPAILWIYPRANKVNEENIHTIAGAAGVAAALDADFAKLKYPYETKDKKKTALNYSEVTQAAGRTKIICVGGSKKEAVGLLEELSNQINLGNTSGLAMGRNLHQRSLEEATRFARALGSIIFKNVDIKKAKDIYNNKTPLKEKSTSKLLSIFW